MDPACGRLTIASERCLAEACVSVAWRDPDRGQPAVAPDRRPDHLVARCLLLSRSGQRDLASHRLRPRARQRPPALRQHRAARTRARAGGAVARGVDQGDRPVASRRRGKAPRIAARSWRRAPVRDGRARGHRRGRARLRGHGARHARHHPRRAAGADRLPALRQRRDPRLQPAARLPPRRGADPAGAGLGPGRGHGPGDLDRGRRRRRWPPSGATATTPSR